MTVRKVWRSPEIAGHSDELIFLRVMRLSTSIAIVYLGQTLLSVVETIVVSRLGAGALAAVSQATAIYSLGFLLIVGAVSPLASMFSDAYARRDGRQFQRNLYLCAALSGGSCLVSVGALLLAPAALQHFGAPGEIASMAAQWSTVAALGLPFMTIFVVSRVVLTAFGRPRQLVKVFLLACPLDAALGLPLTYGFGDFHGLGITGAAIANVVVRFGVGLVSLRILSNELSRFEELQGLGWVLPSGRELVRGAVFCIPVTTRILLAEGVAPTATLLASSVAAAQLAAHVLALRLTALGGILALSISSAAVTVLSQARGGTSENAGPRQAAYGVISAALTVGLGLGLIVGLGSPWWPLLFVGSSDASREVTEAFGQIAWILAAYEVVSTVQTALTGVLLGLLVTKGPLYSVVVGSWGVGILGGWIAFSSGYNTMPVLWSCLTAGSLVAATLNLLLLRSALRQPDYKNTAT